MSLLGDPAGRGSGRQGFTLIEVVIVLFVLGLAAAVVVPSVGRGSDALRTRADVAGFSAFLRHAREQAITRGEPHEVRVDPEARLLVLALSGSEAVRASKRLSSRLRIEAHPPSALTVQFLPHGLSTGGSFRIEGPGGRIYLVSVHPLTGRVTNRRADS